MARLANLGLGLLLAGLVAIAAAVALVPAITGTTPVTIVAGSMGEALPYGTLAYIDPTRTPAIGDIVTLRFGSEIAVTHRVAAIVPDPSGNGIEYVTQGDRNAQPDERHVLPEQVAGVVIASVPNLGLATILLGKLPVQLFIALSAMALYWISKENHDMTVGDRPSTDLIDADHNLRNDRKTAMVDEARALDADKLDTSYADQETSVTERTTPVTA